MSADVIFKLNADVTDTQSEDLLNRIRDLPGVLVAAAVRPDAVGASARRLCFARLTEDADAEHLAASIQDLPEVSYAEVPPKRTIAGL